MSTRLWIGYDDKNDLWWTLDHEADYPDHARLFRVELNDSDQPTIQEMPNELRAL